MCVFCSLNTGLKQIFLINPLWENGNITYHLGGERKEEEESEISRVNTRCRTVSATRSQRHLPGRRRETFTYSLILFQCFFLVQLIYLYHVFLKTLYINHRHLTCPKKCSYDIFVRGNLSRSSNCFSVSYWMLNDDFWSNVYFQQQFLLIVLKGSICLLIV